MERAEPKDVSEEERRKQTAASQAGGPAPGASEGDSEREAADRDTRAALMQLAMVAGLVAAISAVSYLHPSLARFRPWVPGEAYPLASLFSNQEALPDFAGSGAREERTEDLSEAVVANLGDDDEPEQPTNRVRVSPEEYEGIEVFIDNSQGGMNPFYEALRETAIAGDAGDGVVAMTRVTHYGDSSIATDLITSTVRRRMQRRFGDGGHGFILVADGYLPYRHRDILHDSNDEWSLREIVRNHDSSGMYGLGGVQFRGRPGGWASFATSPETPVGGEVTRFEIWHQRHRRGGQIHYEVDGGERVVLETRQEEEEDAIEVVEVPRGDHRLTVRFGGHGQPRLFGVVLENEGAGVVYDSIGLVGARATRLLNYDPEHIQNQLALRGTNLLILAFGGNESSDHVLRERYEARFTAVIDQMRGTRQDLACLVMAPLDQAERGERGQVTTLESISDIVHAQRAAARARGCAFFNTWEAMGGEGSMGEWLSASPRLATSDLRHATPAGYAVIGNMLYKAILKGFADYLEARVASE